jgi:ubiquinone/menaquinone biosynthesis C-methylase UbiE
MDDAKRQVAALFSRVAREYDQAGVEFFSVFGEDLVGFVGVRLGERLLDVGSGRGAVTFPAARCVGERGRVEAIDIAPDMVNALRHDIERDHLSWVRVQVGDAEAPNVPAGSFDVVLASLVLFFLPDLQAALRAYRRVLRPGGRLGFTTFGETDAAWATWEAQLESYLPDNDRRTEQPGSEPEPRTDLLGSPASIRSALADAGYVDIQVEERRYPVRYGTGAAFVRWTQTTGLRSVWDSIPSVRRPQAERDLAAAADQLRDVSGELIEPVAIRFSKATSP